MSLGSSPRVRSRLPRHGLGDEAVRIISACAEQTCIRWPTSALQQDHLRVCGADELKQSGTGTVTWIISACAEQTSNSMTTIPTRTDHLRVCGADVMKPLHQSSIVGSSPRVRSRLAVRTVPARCAGIISACAEQTGTKRSGSGCRWDHLRVCGADSRILHRFGPPRVVKIFDCGNEGDVGYREIHILKQ